MTELYTLGMVVFGVFGWVMYFRERKRSRDYATDLSQLIHDYPLDEQSLHRSLQWREIRNRLQKELEE